ncbi:MAG: DUF2892 domain-containing protein [Panacibacter sp.]
MKRNMGIFDRIFRTLTATAIAVLYFMNVITGGWAIFLLIVAVIFLLTSFVSFCPLYTLLGINTKQRANKKSKSKS